MTTHHDWQPTGQHDEQGFPIFRPVRPSIFQRLYAEAVTEHQARAVAAIRRWQTSHGPLRRIRRGYAKDALRDLRIWHGIAGVSK